MRIRGIMRRDCRASVPAGRSFARISQRWRSILMTMVFAKRATRSRDRKRFLTRSSLSPSWQIHLHALCLFDYPSTVRLIFHRLLILCCLLSVSGLHWFAVQTVAWAGMLATRSSEVGFVDAARTTFDGAHPCALCRTVDQKRSDDQDGRKIAGDILVRLQFVVPVGAAIPTRTCSVVRNPLPAGSFADARSESPSVPPPRVG